MALNTAMYERQRIYKWIGRNRENEMWTGSLKRIYCYCLYFNVWFDSLYARISYKGTSQRKGQKMSVSDSKGLIWQAFREKIVFCVKSVGRKPLKISLKTSWVSFCSANLKLNLMENVSHGTLKPDDKNTDEIKRFCKAILNTYYTLLTKHFVLQKSNMSTQILKCIFSWVFACTGWLLQGFLLDNKHKEITRVRLWKHRGKITPPFFSFTHLIAWQAGPSAHCSAQHCADNQPNNISHSILQ